MKKLLSLILLILTVLTLASCGSAYNKPHKYVSLPALSEITVKNADLEAELDSVIDEILENLSGEYYIPVASLSERVKAGDRVHVSFAPDGDQGLPSDVIETLTAAEKDGIYVIPGSGSSPKPLEDIVLGTKVGDVLSVKISYTEDDTDIEELIGKTITFTVTVHEIARLTVTEQHTVELNFTAKLAGDETPMNTILKLLEGGTETVDLADPEDTFNTVFSPADILPYVKGCRKYESVSFSLTIPADKAKDYGYETDVTLDITATVQKVIETPTAMTDALANEITGGVYTKAADYIDFCREEVKATIAYNAVVKAATFTKDLPEKEYNELYPDNYNAALYAVVGDVGNYTEEQLASMIDPEVMDKIKEMARENTETELRERLVMEYLFDLLKIKLTDKEYNEQLAELYKTYENEYYYMLYYYNITTKEALAEYLGVDYLKAQFSYQKLLPLLKEQISFTD